MPAVDDPLSLAASLPGQVADAKRQIKDLAANNTQAISQALAAATAAANAATAAASAASAASSAASAAATAAYNAVVAPRVGSAGTNTYTLTTSYATYASFNFTVPAGFTQVYINAGGSVTAISQYTSGEFGFARVLINGSAGIEGRALFVPSSGMPAIPAFAVLGLNALVAGSTILVEIQCRLSNGPGLATTGVASASVSGTALFLR